jgi:hypothetical protein
MIDCDEWFGRTLLHTNDEGNASDNGDGDYNDGNLKHRLEVVKHQSLARTVCRHAGLLNMPLSIACTSGKRERERDVIQKHFMMIMMFQYTTHTTLYY